MKRKGTTDGPSTIEASSVAALVAPRPKAGSVCASSGPGEAGWRRAWIYQRERFPLLAHGILILAFSSSAVSFSCLLRGGGGWPAGPSFAVAFVSSLLLFLQLRIADEFKDFDEDARWRPYRAVPRGLVTLKELGWVAGLAALVQLGAALAVQPRLTVILAGVWIYLVLMSREFFVREWIKARPVTYLWTHMLILPLADFYATACDWLFAGGPPPRGLAWFLGVSFFNGVVLEIGRKIRSPDEEEPGVQTYSVLWGRPRAVTAWWTALGVTAFCAVQAARAIQFAGPVAVALAGLLGLAAWVGRRFLNRPSRHQSKWFEHLSGGWTLLMYLGLGLVPMLWKAWR
jgi:UbiA prenyltransferase family